MSVHVDKILSDNMVSKYIKTDFQIESCQTKSR